MIRLCGPHSGFYWNILREASCRIVFILGTAQGRQVTAFSIKGATVVFIFCVAVTNRHKQGLHGLNWQKFILI